jgi:hypothetical protein
LAAGQLHAVAAVAGEADDDGFLHRVRVSLFFGEKMGGCRHRQSFTNASFVLLL